MGMEMGRICTGSNYSTLFKKEEQEQGDCRERRGPYFSGPC